MPHHTLNDLSYHYTRSGEGDPILFLHGFTGCGDNWQPITDSLLPHFQTITIDLPGHGKTDSPADPARYQVEAVAADLHEFIIHIIQAPVHLVGYSMGGRLALYFALHYPDAIRKLVLESASPGLADPAERDTRRASDDQLAARILQNGIAAFVEEWDNLPLFASQSSEIRQRLHTQRLQNNPLGLANSLRGMGTGVQPPLWDLLPSLKPPALILNGALDTKFVAIGEQMARLMPTAHQRIFPNVGHALHLERSTDYTMMLHEFLMD
ncbi:MAG: putative 2-succinyl-6-hydroxy-2,4-cyclohexadiene-1-carboxylate synthase [Chloroflexota bacterium]|nr:MAG: putative 2-succinyl-6-hydroxy-2,4-cyclohexadiene-1-carboxylate synthase [Chloroflexota bacterium]